MIKRVLKMAAMLMLIAGLTAASATVANGQTTKRLIVDVPFGFNIGDKAAAPAGQYEVVIREGSGVTLETGTAATRS